MNPLPSRNLVFIIVALICLHIFIQLEGLSSVEAATLYQQPKSSTVQAYCSMTSDTAWIVYDDFAVEQSGTIEEVAWMGSYYDPPVRGDLRGFRVEFCSDAGGIPSMPFYSTYIGGSANESYVSSVWYGIEFEYSSKLENPIRVNPGQKYWLSIQADLGNEDPPTWGWRQGTGGNATHWLSCPPYEELSTLTSGDTAFELRGHSPQLYAICIGSTHRNSLGLPVVDGGSDAQLIHSRLSQFDMYSDDSPPALLFDYNANPEGSKDFIETQIDHLREDVIEPNDVMIFFFAGHGAGNSEHDDPGPEMLVLHGTPAPSSIIVDDELVEWFSRPGWENVDKLFVLSCCNAGGFGSGTDGRDSQGNDIWDDDLMGLPRCALIAAAEEDGMTVWVPLLRHSLLARDLAKALELISGYARADRNQDGLSFSELATELQSYVTEGDYEGYLMVHPAPDDPNLTTIRHTLVFQESEDWSNDTHLGVRAPSHRNATAWIEQYDGSGMSDEGRHIAVDGSGNIYVVGESQRTATDTDWVIIKYDPNGTELWTRTLGAIDGLSITPNALVVDNNWNMYIAGQGHGAKTGDDCVAIKLDTDGQEAWIAKYNGPADAGDSATAIVVDNSGRIYIGGISENENASLDCVTIGYDANGVQQWIQIYDGPSGGNDSICSIALDNLGSIYVVGTSEDLHGSANMFAIKYTSEGNELWSRRNSGFVLDANESVDIGVDSVGNLFVVGTSTNPITKNDYVAVKYDPHGQELWTKSYNGPAGDEDSACALRVDTDDCVCIVGKSANPDTGYDYAIVKYGPEGHELWANIYNGTGNGHDTPKALAMDSQGNIYVSGASEGFGTGQDYATVSYTSEGDIRWVTRFNGTANDYDGVLAMTTDESDNVIVTGASTSASSERNMVTIKYLACVSEDTQSETQ